MTCRTATRLYLDAIAAIPLSDVETLSEIDFNPVLCLSDHPAAKQVRQAIAIRRHRMKESTWQNATPAHPSIYRALRIDRADPSAFYAAYPFRLAKIGDEHRILAAIGCPAVGDTREPDAIIAWHPPSGRYAVLNDVQPQLIQPDHPGDEANIYGDFFAFARAWAENRAIFYQRRMDQMADKWVHPVSEPRDGNLPGYLVVGDIGKVRLPRQMPAVLHSIGIPAKALNAAIFRTANLPRVNESIMRVAA